jgi:hypothetical protein
MVKFFFINLLFHLVLHGFFYQINTKKIEKIENDLINFQTNYSEFHQNFNQNFGDFTENVMGALRSQTQDNQFFQTHLETSCVEILRRDQASYQELVGLVRSNSLQCEELLTRCSEIFPTTTVANNAIVRC